jgi:tetratricopeptide (TPR) repeat protein
MKTLFILLIAFIISTTNIFPQRDNLELGIRYLKLGNTYREAKDYTKSKEYLNKGLEIVMKQNNKYWIATSKEYMGYLYRDWGIELNKTEYLQRSKEYLQDAFVQFSKIIKQPDGSEVATRMVLENLNYILDEMNGLSKSDDQKIDQKENKYIMNGLRYLARNQNDKAREEFEKALKVNPNSSIANYLIGLTELPYTGAVDTEKTSKKGRVYTSLDEVRAESPMQVVRLDLSDKELKNFPGDIYDLKNLEYLNLSNNELTKLPDDICDFRKLKELNLSNNDISKLPECLYKMKSLEVLYVQGNDIPVSQILNLKDRLPSVQIIMDKEE